VPTVEGRAEHVLEFVRRCDEADRDTLEAELSGGAQAVSPVQHDPGIGHLERDREAALADLR